MLHGVGYRREAIDAADSGFHILRARFGETQNSAALRQTLAQLRQRAVMCVRWEWPSQAMEPDDWHRWGVTAGANLLRPRQPSRPDHPGDIE